MGVVRGDNSLFFSTGLDNSGLERGADQSVGIIQNLASRVGKINPWAVLATTAIVAFSSISSEAYKMVRDFEHAMKEVETISAEVQKDFDGISGKVFNISKMGPDDPEKLAKAYYQIVSAGYDGAEGLALLEVASRSAVAGVTDTITAADGLTTVLNAFGYDVSQVNNIADIFFTTVQRGKTTFPELAQNMAQVAPLASAMGISFEEVSGAVASLTKLGTTTPMALTQIRSAIIGMSEVLGDGWSKTMTFQEGLQKVVDMAGGSETELKNMLGRVEGVAAALSLTGDKAKGAAEDLEAMYHSENAANDATDRMLSSTVNKWEIFENRIKTKTKGLGKFFLGVSDGIVDILNKALEETKDVSEEVIKQASKYQLLKNALDSSNTPFDEKLRILKELKETYPAYLSSLDLDKTKTDNLDETLKKLKGTLEEIQGLHEDKLFLSAFVQNVENAKVARDEYQDLYQDNLNDFKKYASEAMLYANEIGVKMNFSLFDDPEKIYEELQNTLFKEKGNKFVYEIDFGAGRNSWNLTETLQKIRKYKEALNDSNSELQSQVSILDEQRIALYDNELGFKKLASEIQKTFSASELDDKFGMFKDPLFIKAIENQKGVIETLKEIQEITAKEFKKGELDQYLNSENAAIKKAAQQRKNLLEAGISQLDGAEEYKKNLQSKKDAYELYESQVTDIQKKTIADKHKLELDSYKTFDAYITNEIKNHQDNADKIKAIYDILGSATFDLYQKRIFDSVGVPDKASINLDNLGVKELDPTSYNAVLNRITNLEKKARKARSVAEQKELGEKIKNEKKKLEAVKKRIFGEKDEEEKFYKTIQSLSRRGLVDKKKILQKQLIEVKKTLGEESKEYKKLFDQIKKINEEIGSDLSDVASEFSSAFSEISSMFDKFGDDSTAKLFSQLSGMADGIASIASGDIISGTAKVLNSMISVEIVSDTAQFEEAIDKLERAIDKLDYTISKSVGREEVSSRLDAIEQTTELQRQIELANKAELEARKETKLLGITVAKKGEGSGTDPAKLEELQDQAEQARRKIQDLRDELNELFTGATKTTLAEGILEGLEQGKKGLEDFAGTFEDMMRKAILRSFELNYLRDASESFFELFSAYSKDGLEASEINQLRTIFNDIATESENYIEGLNEILASAGIEGLFADSSNSNSMVGAIREEMTEETASIIAGIARKDSDELKRHGMMLVESNEHLNALVQSNAQIEINTQATVDQLVSVNDKLSKIESNTTPPQSANDMGI